MIYKLIWNRMPDENSTPIGAKQTSQNDQSNTNQIGDDFVLDFGESGDIKDSENTEQSYEDEKQTNGDLEKSDSESSVKDDPQDKDGDLSYDDFDISFDDNDEYSGSSSEKVDKDGNSEEDKEESGDEVETEEKEEENESFDFGKSEEDDREESEDEVETEEKEEENESFDFGKSEEEDREESGNEVETEEKEGYEEDNESFDFGNSEEEDREESRDEIGTEENEGYEEDNESFDFGNSEEDREESGDEIETERGDYYAENEKDKTDESQDLPNDNAYDDEKNGGGNDNFIDIDIPEETENDSLDGGDDYGIQKDSSLIEDKNEDNEERHNLFINSEEDLPSNESNNSYSDMVISDDNQDNYDMDNSGYNNHSEYEPEEAQNSTFLSTNNEDSYEQSETSSFSSDYSLDENTSEDAKNINNDLDMSQSGPRDESLGTTLEENDNKIENEVTFNHYEDYLNGSEDVNQNSTYQDVNEMNFTNDSESQSNDKSLEEKSETENINEEQKFGIVGQVEENQNGNQNEEIVNENNNSETPKSDVLDVMQEQSNHSEESALEVKTTLNINETVNETENKTELNLSPETPKQDENKEQNNGNLSFSLDQILNTDGQQNKQENPVTNTENIKNTEQSASNLNDKKKMVGVVVGVVVFMLLGVVAYLAFPKGSSIKQEPDTIVAGIQQPIDDESHGIAVEEKEPEFPDVNPIGEDVDNIGGGEIDENKPLGGSTVQDMDDENSETLDEESDGNTENNPTPYIPDDDFYSENEEDTQEKDQEFVDEIKETLQKYKKEGELYYELGQERLDNDIIKNAKRVIYLCENYEKKLESGEGVDENSWLETESQIQNKMSKISNGGLEDIEFENTGHLDDDSYFEGKEEHTDYIYDRYNGYN